MIYIKLKKILKDLDDYKDSYKKIEEIKTLLIFENECKKINIKDFVKILVIVIIITLVCLVICLFIDKKSNKLYYTNSNNLYEENDKFNNYLNDELYDYLKDESYDLYKNEIYKLIKILEKEGYKKKCFDEVSFLLSGDKIISPTEECDEIYDIYYLYKDDTVDKELHYFFDIDNVIFGYRSKTTQLEYDLSSNKVYLYFESLNEDWIFFEKEYKSNLTTCGKSKTLSYIFTNFGYLLVSRVEPYLRSENFVEQYLDCENLISVENTIDNFKNEITNYVEKANVDINNIKKYFKVRDEYFQKYDEINK